VKRSLLAAIVFTGALGCAPEPREHPTWVDVQPILAGECVHCHGAGADLTGSERTGGGFRFDFYDMKADVCGVEVAKVIGDGRALALARAGDILTAISTPADKPDERPRMPPPPAPYLHDWEWGTIQAWVNDGAPKGDLPPSNRPPRFRLYHDSGPADATLDVTAVIEDPDGDPVAGVLMFGDVPLPMNRGGAFSETLDTSSWASGDRPITAVLCDGWAKVMYAVGTVTVQHAE
jgi:hypothetical protein